MRTTLLALSLAALAPLDAVACCEPEYCVIYDFGGVNAIPASALTWTAEGTYSGVTYGGAGEDGTGSVYALTRSGFNKYKFTTLYRTDIGGSPANDGQFPFASLILSPDGTTLMGTTQLGGSGGGVLFGLNYSAALAAQNNGVGYQIEHWFNPTLEGGGSQSRLALPPVATFPVVYFGALYGDGPRDGGAAYSFNMGNSAWQPLHQWSVSSYVGGLDGGNPIGSLVVHYRIPLTLFVKPEGATPDIITNLDLSTITLYGVTRIGGSNNCGTIYSVQGNGSNYMVLHHFNTTTDDGANPMGGMVLVSNVLYGTTSSGGANHGGTVFKINTDGTGFAILANLDYATTGSSPQGDLAISESRLYGTTYVGGTNGGGTVFALNLTDTNLTLLHRFTSPVANGNGGYTNRNGGWPQAGVLVDGDSLYGTTSYGGTNGVGTAYRIALPSPPRLRLEYAAGSFRLSWPSRATNFFLQENSALGTKGWGPSALAVSDNGTNRSVVLLPTGRQMFFRLLDTNAP